MLSSTTNFFPEGEEDYEDEEESFHSSLSTPLLLRSNTDGTIISEPNDNDDHAEEAAAVVPPPAAGGARSDMAAYHTVGGGAGGGGARNSSSSSSSSSHSNIRMLLSRLLRRCVQWKSAADALPTPFHVVVTNGKICALAVFAGYLLFISLWFPFWLLCFILTEWGVYALVICTIFVIGRSIIRLIAFPGASQKVTKEIEVEFQKYSVRMIVSAAQAMSELAVAVIHALESAAVAATTATNKAQPAVNNNNNNSNIPGLWRRAKMVRDRVLGVYLEVLLYLYQQAPTSSNSNQDAFINKFGNNRLQGDVGTLGNLTVRVK
jgi:hypothetical protein